MQGSEVKVKTVLNLFITVRADHSGTGRDLYIIYICGIFLPGNKERHVYTG